MSIAKWLDDLDYATAGMPFGEVHIKVTRHRSKTSKVVYTKDSKLVPKDNVEAFSDLQKFLSSLVNAEFEGDVQFAVSLKKGIIQLITIKNKETKTYGDH